MEKRITAARLAIDSFGGPRELADALVGEDAPDNEKRRMLWRVRKWRDSGVPPKWTLQVEELTGVPRHTLNPNIYPKP